jgi:AcrR family transcriptional regulator
MVIMIDTRQRLLDAAADVFAERGYEGATLADIARKAGFTTGAIYSRFRDKAELLLAVVERILASLQDAAVEAATGNDLGAVASRLTDAESGAMRSLVLEAHVAARRNPAVGEVLRRFQSERLDALTRAVKEAQAAGDVDPSVDANAVATLFMAIPLGLVLLDTAGVDLPSGSAWTSLAEHTAASLRPERPTKRSTRAR